MTFLEKREKTSPSQLWSRFSPPSPPPSFSSRSCAPFSAPHRVHPSLCVCCYHHCVFQPPQDLFQNLIRYLDAADLRILSAFKSYVYLRHKSDTAARMSPIARAKDHQVTVAQAEAAAARSSGWDVSSGRAGLSGRRANGMGTYKRRQSSPGRVPHPSGGGGGSGGGARAAGVAEDVLSEVTVPVSLINIVVHADQRLARLRMFHFADALPSLPPPPPPPPAHNTPSPRLLRPRGVTRGGTGGRAGGGGSRDSGEIRQLPTTKEGVATGKGAGVVIPGESQPGQEGEKKDAGQDARGSGQTVRRCATCEAQPVVQIDDGQGGSAAGGKEGGGGGRGRAGSVHEGDLSANEQVWWAGGACGGEQSCCCLWCLFRVACKSGVHRSACTHRESCVALLMM